MIRHIIWDWNGTLVDDMPLALRVMNRMLARRNMPFLSEDRYLATFDHPVQNFYRNLGFDFSAEPFDNIAHEFGQGYKADWASCSLHAGAREALEQFHSLGLSQSILSASERGVLERNVNYFKLSGLLSDLSALEDHLAHSKLEQGLKWHAASKLCPSEIVLIGDTTHDFEVARALGCKCILFAGGHQSRQRLESCTTHVVGSLSAIRL